jgi:hypothetical protein
MLAMTLVLPSIYIWILDKQLPNSRIFQDPNTILTMNDSSGMLWSSLFGRHYGLFVGESMVNLRPGAGCLSRELAPGAGCEPRGKGLQFGSTNTKENMKGIL